MKGESRITRKTVKLKNPVLIAGLPGIGFVGKMAIDHLVGTMKAEHFATLYSPHFPNQVLAMKSGALKPFTMKFYAKRLGKRDYVFLRGDLQPITVEGQYEVSARILSLFGDLGGKDVIAMAGYAVGSAGEKRGIYCAGTSKKFNDEMKKAGATKLFDKIIPIVGMAGLLPALARGYGMRGACLLVETNGHNIDGHGAKALVELLARYTGQKFDTKLLEKRAAKAEAELTKMEQQARAAQQAPAPAQAVDADQTRLDATRYIR
ncbi:PAC2 family protein [Candidatus Norongarragalina meridionalis]|nr:PAC2 family protein [Candidatus Norongarragalina meridionalis]